MFTAVFASRRLTLTGTAVSLPQSGDSAFRVVGLDKKSPMAERSLVIRLKKHCFYWHGYLGAHRGRYSRAPDMLGCGTVPGSMRHAYAQADNSPGYASGPTGG
jgi:hypothetical protein